MKAKRTTTSTIEATISGLFLSKSFFSQNSFVRKNKTTRKTCPCQYLKHKYNMYVPLKENTVLSY